MMQTAVPAEPLWLRILQFPLTRLIVLGGIVFYLMARSDGIMERFKDTPVREALAFLAQQSKEHEQGNVQNEWGVQIVLKIDSNVENALVNLDLDNMSLREALRYTCMLSGLKFKADNRVVIVAMQSDPTFP
jgi:hypothetical protein